MIIKQEMINQTTFIVVGRNTLFLLMVKDRCKTSLNYFVKRRRITVQLVLVP